MQLTFGKYKNKDIYETMDLDPNYCKWLYQLDITKERSPELYEILDKRFKDEKIFICRGENTRDDRYDGSAKTMSDISSGWKRMKSYKINTNIYSMLL